MWVHHNNIWVTDSRSHSPRVELWKSVMRFLVCSRHVFTFKPIVLCRLCCLIKTKMWHLWKLNTSSDGSACSLSAAGLHGNRSAMRQNNNHSKDESVCLNANIMTHTHTHSVGRKLRSWSVCLTRNVMQLLKMNKMFVVESKCGI